MGKNQKIEGANMSDFWKDFESGKLGVQCKSYEEAETFLEQCQLMGIQWESGECATAENYWSRWGSDTCYLIDRDTANLLVSNVSLSREYDYEVMVYSPDIVCKKNIKEFWEGFFCGDIAVRCQTYAEIIAFIIKCGRRGLRWDSHLRLEFEANWWTCGRKTQWCIGIRKSKGGYIVPGKEKDFEGCKILDYKNLYREEKHDY